MRHASTAAVLTTKPQQRWWQSTNRTVIAFGLLLCVVLGVGGAYLLGTYWACWSWSARCIEHIHK